MSRLEEIKNEVVQEYGYNSFEQFDDQSTFNYDHDTPEIIKNIALKYAHECAAASLEKASERIDYDNCYAYSSERNYAEEQSKSITNLENIVLL